MAVESGLRLRAMADRQRLEQATGGNPAAERSLKLAAWLHEVGNDLASELPVDALEVRQRIHVEALVDRLWEAHLRDADDTVVSALVDLMELTLRANVARAITVLRLRQPRFTDLNPELVRLAAEAWSQGKRRGPIRVLMKALGLEAPLDDALDRAIEERDPLA